MSAARLKMRELERATGVGRETIRYYIREGLLPEPERPGRNVAWYDPSFVERITLIKELQQKRFLPLHVIKTILAGPETTPSRNEVQALLELDGKLFPAVAGGPAVPPERVSELAARTGLPASHLRELAAAGAIDLVTRDGETWVEGDAIRVVEIWATLRRAGFTEALGFRPANLRLYVDMLSWLAHEELRLFTRGIAGRVDTEKARRMAEDGITYLNQLIALLRKTTLLRWIAQGNVPPAEGAASPASTRRRGSGVRALRGPRRARRPAPKPH